MRRASQTNSLPAAAASAARMFDGNHNAAKENAKTATADAETTRCAVRMLTLFRLMSSLTYFEG